jgi:hypothetical protein
LITSIDGHPIAFANDGAVNQFFLAVRVGTGADVAGPGREDADRDARRDQSPSSESSAIEIQRSFLTVLGTGSFKEW